MVRVSTDPWTGKKFQDNNDNGVYNEYQYRK